MKNQPTRQPTRLLKPLRKNRPPLAHKSPEPMLEPLEPRQLLATITWDGGPDGTGTNLANPVNWSGDVLPGPADDAIISSGGPLLSLAESLAVNTLTSNRELTISGGLAIGNTASISATITLAGGTISGGTWNLTNPVGVNATSTGGTIADANINGTIVVDLTGTQAANLQIEGSTRFLAAKLRGNGSELAFATGYILNDPVIAEGATGGVRLVNFQGAARIGPAGSLAFAAGAFTTIVCVASTQFRNGGTINATAPGTAVRVEAPGFLNTGTITLAQGSIQFGSGTFINEGTFTSQNGLINLAAITNRAQFSLLGTSSAIIGTGIFRNEGTLSITGIPATFGGALTNLGSIALQNANLRLTSTWSSTGTITAQSSTLTLTSDVATSTLNIPGWSLTNTTVRIESILNNAGNILTLTPSSGQWTLAGGTLGGGIVSLASGVVLTALGSPTILNVAVQGTVTVAPSGFLQVRGITTADRILLRGNASVNFFTTEPFEGEIVATEASPARGISFNAPFALGESGRIRIDSTATGTFNILSNSSTAGFTNRGQIIIESPSTTLSVTVPSFTNATTGTITAPAATVINLNTAFSNAGTFNAQNCAITISVPSTQSLFGFTLAGLNIAGSSVTFSGVLVNPSLDFTGRNLTWRFNNATVNGGTIIAPTGQVTFGPNVTLASALLTGDFTVASGGTATFDETDLPQTLRISGGGIAAFASPITITSTIIFGLTGTGAGTLAFDQATTLAPSAQLQLASSSGINISGLGTLTNQTTIDIGGRSLVFDITRVINQGTLRAGPEIGRAHV